jgi:hypothetical protein
MDARGARSADAEAASAPAAPRIEPGGRLDLVVRAVAAAYLRVLLAAVVLYMSAFVKMVYAVVVWNPVVKQPVSTWKL